MPQSLSQVYLHLVFSTKHRRPLLADADLRRHTHAYLAGICENHRSHAVRIGGVADHVHILCRLGRTIAIADLIRELKRPSSGWLKEQGVADFDWQDGYGAFSVSPAHVHPLVAYIENQETHRRTESFQEEFRRLLRKYQIEFDERYVWD